MINFSALLDGPIYGSIGKPARITPADSPGAVDITAIDLTKGVTVGSSPGVQSVAAAAKVRLADLAAKGVDLAALKGGTITLNVGASTEKTWGIHSVQPKPAPEGEDAGELYLFLVKAPGA